jgi:NAD(P)-dependent dehydrogenase (short-subunit alcohol dehydrogenase family)
MRSLEGKVAVITGAGSGIGRALALRLAGQGVTVAVVDLAKDSATKVVTEIRASGGRASAHGADVSSEGDMRVVRDEVLATHGVVDIVVNNAGILHEPRALVETDMADIHRVLDVNLLGVIHGSVVFLPDLLARKEANLVNVASYAGLLGATNLAAYCTSKFGVRGFTESLRMEMTGSPVTVTLVLPGVTKTPIMTNSPLMPETRKARLQATFDGGPGVSADVVAEAVIGGIVKNKPRVLVGKDTKGVDLLTRIAPGAYSKLLAGSMRKTIEKNFGS